MTVLNIDVQRNFQRHGLLSRAIGLLVMFFLFSSISTLLFLLALAQLLHMLFMGTPHIQLKWVGKAVAKYLCKVYCYLIGASRKKPFPFNMGFHTRQP